MVLQVTELDELLAMNRALMEVRYLASGSDEATRGSTFLSEIHARVIDAIKSEYEQVGDQQRLRQWEEWQTFNSRVIEKACIVRYVAPHWASLSGEMRRIVLENQMRPFVFSDQEVEEMIDVLDSGQVDE